MNRREFFKTTGAAALLPFWATPSHGTEARSANERTRTGVQRPNFVFILIDDLGWADLGCYGSAFYETPNIDRLAAQGMRFTDAYAACPVCSPTRASIVTGKYPARLGITQWIGASNEPTPYRHDLPLEEVTIAEALKEAGYATGFVGKWHLANRDEDRYKYYPDKQGFDVNIAGDWSGSPPTYFYPYERGNRSLETMPPGGTDGEYLTDRLTDESLKFLDAHRDRPFLLYLSHYAVHTPLQAKDEPTQRYRDKARREGIAETSFKPVYGKYRTRDVQNHPVYAAMIQSVDESVGRVMSKLLELDLQDNTIVIFMSDNGGLATVPSAGPTCNRPLRSGKGWLYEGGIREPMLIKWPGVVKESSVCDVPVTSTDFYPTMLEMAGLPLRPTQHIDGISLVPLLKRTGTLPDRALYWHYPHYHGSGSRPSGAVRAGDYKLIEWYEDGTVELYNLKEDLGEKENLAAQLPEKAAQLQRMLAAWRRTVDAKMPSGPPRQDFQTWADAREG